MTCLALTAAFVLAFLIVMKLSTLIGREYHDQHVRLRIGNGDHHVELRVDVPDKYLARFPIGWAYKDHPMFEAEVCAGSTKDLPGKKP